MAFGYKARRRDLYKSYLNGKELTSLVAAHISPALDQIDNTPTTEPARALSPISPTSSAMNSSNALSTTGTIRSVPNESTHLDAAQGRRAQGKPETMPHSTIRQSTTSPTLANPTLRQLPVSRAISSEFGATRSYTANSLSSDPPPTNQNGGSAWSSAVGGAASGKSGRVIEKLMAENDTLKRQIKYEQARADEANQAYKSVKSLIDAQTDSLSTAEQTIANLEASIKRKERTNNDLKVKIITARLAADQAAEDELKWRTMAQSIEKESIGVVEEANSRAALFEGRANTMSTHWKSQGAAVERTVNKVRTEIAGAVTARQEDDKRMTVLAATCDQQARELEKLRADNAAILDTHQRYVAEQELSLKNIKQKASVQEQSLEEKIAETTRVLGQLKWALNVHSNVPGAH